MNSTLYIVIPCYKEQEVLHETASRLKVKMESLIAAGKISSLEQPASHDITTSFIYSHPIFR